MSVYEPYTVIIPTHNRAPTLRIAIDSALRQTLPPYELIIVDDASSDDTVLAIERAQAEDPRVCAVSLESRGGANKARNRGAALSRTNYLTFLDSDDKWLPDKARLQMDVIRRDQTIGCVGCWFEKVDGGGRSIYTGKSRSPISQSQLLFFNVFGPTSCILVRKDLFNAVGGFDETMESCQDWELLSRLLGEGDGIIVQKILVSQSVASANRISSDSRRVLAGHRAVFARLRPFALQLGFDPKLVDAKFSSSLIEIMLRNRLWAEALAETLMSPSLKGVSRWLTWLLRPQY